MASESGVPPPPRARSFATPHHTTQLFRFPMDTRFPIAPRPARSTDRVHSLHGPDRPERPGPCRVTGRTLLGLSCSAVSNRLQPVRTEACQPRLVAPALHPTRAPQRAGIRDARQTRCPVDDRSSNLAHSPFGPDRATTEGYPHRVQPGSTRVSQVHDPRYGLTPLA